MAMLQALIASIMRSAGRLLNTACSWATVMLFGQVPQDRQIYLSALAFGAVIWIIALVGVIVPSFTAFMVIGPRSARIVTALIAASPLIEEASAAVRDAVRTIGRRNVA